MINFQPGLQEVMNETGVSNTRAHTALVFKHYLEQINAAVESYSKSGKLLDSEGNIIVIPITEDGLLADIQILLALLYVSPSFGHYFNASSINLGNVVTDDEAGVEQAVLIRKASAIMAAYHTDTLTIDPVTKQKIVPAKAVKDLALLVVSTMIQEEKDSSKIH